MKKEPFEFAAADRPDNWQTTTSTCFWHQQLGKDFSFSSLIALYHLLFLLSTLLQPGHLFSLLFLCLSRCLFVLHASLPYIFAWKLAEKLGGFRKKVVCYPNHLLCPQEVESRKKSYKTLKVSRRWNFTLSCAHWKSLNMGAHPQQHPLHKQASVFSSVCHMISMPDGLALLRIHLCCSPVLPTSTVSLIPSTMVLFTSIIAVYVGSFHCSSL